MSEKIANSKNYNDTMPFTVMSKNVLKDEYKDQYRNVYEKGALLAMCLDIELRKLSNGEMGYRDMIRKLSQRFGENKPFKDDKLIDELVTVTGYPQVKDFYNKYIAGDQPTPYAQYLSLVGVEAKKQETPPIFWFIKDPQQTGFDDKDNAFVFDESSALSPFSKSIGFKITDKIVALDGKTINVQNIQSFVEYAKSVKEGQNVTVTVLRKNGDKTEKLDLKGKAILDKMTIETLQFKSNPTAAEQKLQDQWLTGKK